MEKSTLSKQIEFCIVDSEPGYVFSAIDYTPIAVLNTVYQILFRLEKEGHEIQGK